MFPWYTNREIKMEGMKHMYTLFGLQDAAKSEVLAFSKQYLSDGITLLEETQEEMNYYQRTLHEIFGETVEKTAYDISTAIDYFHVVAQQTKDTIQRSDLLQIIASIQYAYEKRKEISSYVFGKFENMPKKELEKPQYAVLQANGFALHKLGPLTPNKDDYFTIFYETADYYIGSFWDSGFFNVYFRKSDARPLTKEEEKELL